MFVEDGNSAVSQTNKMKIRNTHKIVDSKTVQRLFDFVRLPGCEKLTVKTKNSTRHWGGRAYLSRRLLVARASANPKHYPMYYRPYQYAQFKGKKYWVRNPIELLLVVLAHEARHFWQHAMKNRRGYAWGSRGKYSEIDTESYAINKLRAWRKAT